MRQLLERCRLYTFIDTSYLRGRDPGELARQLCDGGSDLIQLRAKDKSIEEITQLGLQLRPILSRYGVGMVVNDHWEVAKEVGADFCHLGQEDFFDRKLDESPITSQLPPIGLSTHAPDQAARAIKAGPAYIAIGPVYPTPTKPGVKPVTVEYVRWAAQNVRLPWFAIGGITLANLAAVMDAGATRVCVVSAILNAPDPAKACGEFKRRLTDSVG
jgi:thiamine-phosphate pyrophosphorylase